LRYAGITPLQGQDIIARRTHQRFRGKDGADIKSGWYIVNGREEINI